MNVYTPNAKDGLARIDERLVWDERYREFLGELAATKPVVTCGDFNVAHEEIDLKNPGPNRGNAGFSDEERESFTKLLDSGFTDTFRARFPELTGAYSWWSYRFRARANNAGWRIDYFLVSEFHRRPRDGRRHSQRGVWQRPLPRGAHHRALAHGHGRTRRFPKTHSRLSPSIA